MRITCESCTTTFNLDERLLKPAGSKVRCSNCRHVFLAFPPDTVDSVAEPPLPPETPMTGDDSSPDFEKEPGLSDLEMMLQPLADEINDIQESAEELSNEEGGEEKFRKSNFDDPENHLATTIDDTFALDLDELNRPDESSTDAPPLSDDTGEPEVSSDFGGLEPSGRTLGTSEEPLPHGANDGSNLQHAGLEGMEKSRRVHPFLLFLLTITLIIGAAYWGAYWAHRNRIQIPLVSQFGPMIFGPSPSSEAQDAGARDIATIDINSKIIENRTSGKLFVISGQVRNDYDNPRGIIHIKGDLFTEGQKHVKSESVYCGNVLSDLDLAVMDIEAIRRRLGDRFGGEQKANLKVMPNQSLPFMIVFDNLPEGLDEFTLEILGSIAM